MRELPTSYSGTDADASIRKAGAVDNPLPRSVFVKYADNPLLWDANVFDRAPEFIDVQLANLRTMQDYVIPDRVAQYLLPPDERPESTKQLTAIIRVGNELVIINGTHRAVAYWLQEEPEIRVMDFGRWAKNNDGKWEQAAMPKSSKAIDPPDDDESHGDFIDRCTAEGNDEDECELVWEEERGMKAAGRIRQKTHSSPGSSFSFVLSDESPDRVGDIIMSDGWDVKGFKKNPIALFNHDKDAPIGVWKNIHIDKQKKQLQADLQLADAGTSPRIDEIRSLIEQDVLRATSVGFLPTKMEPLEDDAGPFGSMRFLEQELLEVSLVAVPANRNALRIMKSLGISAATQELVLRGSGKQQAAAGAERRVVKRKEANMARKSVAEQIAGFEATRAAKAARMLEIMEESDKKGETLDGEQQEAYDELANEVKAVDAHLGRLRILESTNLKEAKEAKGDDSADATRSRNNGSNGSGGNGHDRSAIVRVEGMRSNVPKGILFARHFIARMYSQLNPGVSAIDAARAMGYYEQTPELEEILKAAVTVGTTTGTTWAKPLAEPTFMAAEFIELLKPLTIIGRIPGLRRVPFNIKIPREITAASVNWVGEGKPKPVSAMAFDSISLGFTKVAGIVPVTEELFRFSNPAIESLVRDSLLDAVALLTDRDFLDPSKAEVTGISPASITNGASAHPASGTSADALRTDLGTILGAYAADNMSLTGLVLVMTSVQAVRIGLMRNTLGAVEFPGISPQGGSLEGIPVVTSQNIVGTGGSPPTGSLIVAINAPEILLADDGAVAVDMSREASLQMDSAPDDPTTATTVLVSLWQRNMVALRAERMINWMRRRNGAVHYITNANYA